jgi:hypothetical protein
MITQEDARKGTDFVGNGSVLTNIQVLSIADWKL